MELSEVEFVDGKVVEVAQYRIPTPGSHVDEGSYCEKNWMPILDMPYHFIKWTNGTEVVRFDLETKQTEKVVLTDFVDHGTMDLRGGSQVIPFGNDGHRFCLTHETHLKWSDAGRKDATYRHRFIVWDKDWNIVKISRLFSFFNAEIEFAVGMCESGNDYLITTGFQDNAAYLLKVSKDFVRDFIFE